MRDASVLLRFARTLLRQGQILDMLSDKVRLHPGFFRWPERDVTTEDIERMERLEALERGDHAA